MPATFTSLRPRSLLRVLYRQLYARKMTCMIGVMAVMSITTLFVLNLCALPNNESNRVLHIYVDDSLTSASPVRFEVEQMNGVNSLLPKSYLIVVIFTGIENVERRNAIRATWLSGHRDRSIVRALFTVGVRDISVTKKKWLNKENLTNGGDMMFLTDIRDSYPNLTPKLSSTLRWLTQRHRFVFLLKVDDDSFVRLDELLRILRGKPDERFYYGFFNGRGHVKKKGKWLEKDWFMCDYYLPYAVGGGYVITQDLALYVARNRALLKHYKSEDVSMGSWLSPLDIQREHDPRFDTEYVSRGCHNDYVVSHKQTVTLMTEKQESLARTGSLCVGENRTRLSYVYNWNVPPSQCCTRRDASVP